MKKIFLVILAGGILYTACTKEEKKIMKNNKEKKLEIKNPNFILISENYISNNCIGELYVNKNNLADTLFVIKKMINETKSETTWEGTFGVEVTPISSGQNQVTYTCDGEPHSCKGTCSFDSKGNIIGCRINILN